MNSHNSRDWDNRQLWGTVTAVQANFYQVRLVDLDSAHKSATSLLCTRRSLLKKIGQKVVVGDRVLVEEPDWQDGRGVISKVLERKTELHRPPVANADQILLVFSVAEPELDPWQLSRFLVKAESTNLKTCLCLNKCDLVSKLNQQKWQQRLANWGYQANFISVLHKQGLSELQEALQDSITIVAGPSGVGKSSLINNLIPQIDLKIGKVSGKLQKGRHTTRHVELFDLPGGGLLADSPGFNQPDLTCDPLQLAWYFPEARERLQQQNCQFNNCSHRNEPNCVVRGDWERYEYYRDFLENAIAHKKNLQSTANENLSKKLKVKRSSKAKYEPILATKKYRQVSRKSKNQNLQDLSGNFSVDDIDEDFS